MGDVIEPTAGEAPKAGNAVKAADTTRPNIADVVQAYVHAMDAMSTALPLLMGFMRAAERETRKQFEQLRDEHGKIASETETEQYIYFPLAQGPQASKLLRQLGKLSKSSALVPPSFLMALVSQYDAFLSQLISNIFYMKPEILAGSERKLTFSELVTFESIASAQEYIIEKEVESVLRESHAKQFDWLERKLQMELRKDLSVWADFIELTERRNLLTHADGIVSSHYLAVCKQHGVQFEQTLKVGERLRVNPAYFKKAHNALFEIGFKLAHVIWRKLAPQDRAAADQNLNAVGYDLLKEGRFEQARTVYAFGCGLKKYSTERMRRMFIINYAQACKFGNDERLALDILKAEDWSVCGREFQLCLAVLRDDFSAAAIDERHRQRQ